MVNSIQLQGLTYIRSLGDTGATDKSQKTEDQDFESVLDDKLKDTEEIEKDGTSSITYTDPKDLKVVDSPSSLEVYFQKAADTYGVPIALIKAVAKAESNFNPKAVSSAGAQGVMQLMPATAKGLGVEDAFDAEQNIMAGTKYLAKMLTKYNGSVKLALSAYNAGAGNVDKYEGVPPFEETKNYITRIFGYLGRSTETSQTESTQAKDNVKNQDSKLSTEDITKIADAVIKGIQNGSTSKTANELYSALYGATDQNKGQAFKSYSSVLNNLLNT